MPTPTGETVEPEMVQTPALEGETEKVTASPELADAETAYADPPATEAEGGEEVKLIDWTLGAGGPPIVNDCWTCGAGPYVASPGWSASTVQVPAPVNETVEPETVQTETLLGFALKTTGRPDEDVAVTA